MAAALIVAGCSSSGSKTSTSNTTAPAAASVSATTAANATPVKVGFLLSFSGPSAAGGATDKPFIDAVAKRVGSGATWSPVT